MCSICGSMSLPSGRVGSGRSPATIGRDVVVTSDEDDPDGPDAALPPPELEHAASAAAAPAPTRKFRRESIARQHGPPTPFFVGTPATAAATPTKNGGGSAP